MARCGIPVQEDRRQSLLALTLKMFVEKGFGGVSTAEIAARFGISKTTLYKFYDSKEKLFAAAVTRGCEVSREEICAFPEPEGDARSILTAFCLHFLRKLGGAEHVAFYRMVVAEARQFPEIGWIFQQSCMEGGCSCMQLLIRRLMDLGDLRQDDVRKASSLLLTLVTGRLNLRWLLGPGAGPDAELVAEAGLAAEMFLRIYRPDV